MMHHFHRVHVNIWLVVGLVLVVFTWGWWSFQKDLVDPAVDVVNIPINIAKKAVNVVTKPSAPDAPAATLSYTNALDQYGDARIQLDKDCRANPTSATFKNGTSIMIDNRASVTRSVVVGSSFSIPAYGFKIVKLSSSTLPVTWGIDCDTSKNVSAILIQK